MPHTFVYLVSLALAGGTVLGTTTQSASQPAAESMPNAVSEHLDEASDLTDRLMRWKHITTPRGDDAPLRVPPKSTLISIERSDAQKLHDLINAMAMQLPGSDVKADMPRGDVRAHVEKAQQISRELLPAGKADSSGLVLIDRTALERLDVELDALEDLRPIVNAG